MSAPIPTFPLPVFAGFEPTRPHWNGHDTLVATGHASPEDVKRNYEQAILAGATGFRESLPERFDVEERYEAARYAAGLMPVVWSACHFERQRDPVGHALRVARMMGEQDRMIAVNESTVGPGVSGLDDEEAFWQAAFITKAAPEHVRFWVCEPFHSPWPHHGLRRIVDKCGDRIEVIGLNIYPHHAGAPIRELLQAAREQFPDRQLAITETGWHRGHLHARARFPHLPDDGFGWLGHVLDEIAASGVDLHSVCWFPWLNASWEADQFWHNGWPLLDARQQEEAA